MTILIPDDAEEIECQGIRVPFVPEIITPMIERPLRRNRYEVGELGALRKLLRPGDRVLDLGAGIGLISAAAAQIVGPENVVAVEANPALIPLIREVHARNGVRGVDVRTGIAAPEAGPARTFYLRRDFWASSIEPGSRPFAEKRELPVLGLDALMREARPTVVVCDVEGAELGLFEGVRLDGVRAIIIEFHPKVYGESGRERILKTFADAGFLLSPDNAHSSVRMLYRPEPLAIQRAPQPKAATRFLIATCMKDEGPFVLEWLAWHKAIGVTDFVVFTNDCSDGTDTLLDRLDVRGEVRHLPNPATAVGRTDLQPTALKYVPGLREFREADYFLSIDVDEFVNVRVGNGHLSHLISAVGAFDVLSISEILHGSNDRIGYERGLVTEQFPRHQTEYPGWQKKTCGVKSLVRLSDRIARVRNHRPDVAEGLEDAVWLDGSGRPIAHFLQEPRLNGHDVRETYALVSLEHYPLRSLESYLVKLFRGDVVVQNRIVKPRYWRRRNRNEDCTSTLERQQTKFRTELARLLDDPETRDLHEAACQAHEARIAALLTDPHFAEWKATLLAQNKDREAKGRQGKNAVA